MINPWRDTAVFAPREVRAFHALEEECGLDDETLSRFKEKFQFPDRVRVRLPCEEEWACHFFFGEVCFYEATFLCGLRLPVHPFIMELLDDFGIALGQLISCFLGIGGLGFAFVIQILEVPVLFCIWGWLWDPLQWGLGWSPKVAPPVGNPKLRCVIISLRPLIFFVFSLSSLIPLFIVLRS